MQGAVFGALLDGPLKPTPKRKYQVTVVTHLDSMHVYLIYLVAYKHPIVCSYLRQLQGTNQTFVFTTIHGEPRLFRPTG